MVRWKRDVIYAIGLLVFSIAGWIIAGTFVQKNISVWAAYPSTYCRGVLTILGVLAILQLIRALHEKPREVLPAIWTKQSVITVIALALYVYLLNKVQSIFLMHNRKVLLLPTLPVLMPFLSRI